ncbi:MAG: right-handed parallel beta-helix repeat-containing protein [Candidatus Latescibacterota bacterium]|nr:MAG: right-handed parallel beta-helix repeat-containing protein [Candidatus Latescibacterota bacterium]
MKKLCGVLSFSIIVVLIFAPSVSAKTWNINPGGTGDAPTIQAGIDSASGGDIVLLAPGTYIGPQNREIDFKGKAITVTSSGGATATTIDCQGFGRGFVFQSGEGPSSVLSDVRIVNGAGVSFGGAVYCIDSSPTIERNIFFDNHATFRGGAVYCDTSSALIHENDFEQNNSAFGGALWCSGLSSLTVTDNEFKLNSASISGGAIGCRGSSPTVDGNLFEENSAANDGGAIQCDTNSGATLSNNTFRDNSASGNGGGVAYDQSPLSIQFNVFQRNSAALGGGIYCTDILLAGEITNNTLDEGTADNGAGIYCTNNSRPPISHNIITNSTNGEPVFTKNNSAPTISCCCFYSNAGGDALPPGSFDGGGNFFEDPEFCGIDGTGNYFLQSDSPCAPGGHFNDRTYQACGLIGALPVDCGTSSTEIKTWGAIKAIYQDQ